MGDKLDKCYLGCRCSCSMVEFERDPDGDMYISLWLHGYGGGRLSFKERLRWCWNIITTGRPWTDYAIASPEEVRKLREWLQLPYPKRESTP